MKHINIKIFSILFLCITALCSCHTKKQISRFTTSKVELGISKSNFLATFGQPFSQTQSFTHGNELEEKLYYKEKFNLSPLYKETGFIVTTIFTFQDSKLIKQEIKEDKMFEQCDCQKQ